MAFETWLSFVVVAIVVVLSPGPAVLLAVSRGAQFGVRCAAWAILGNISGLAVLISASAIGVASVLATSNEWLLWLRIVGGAYLVYLGVRLLLSQPPAALNMADAVNVPSRRKSYIQGVVVALSNPKALLFIGALFPQFLDPSVAVEGQLVILGATLMSMSFIALVIYAALSKTLVLAGRETLYGKINKITGGLFVFFGLALAAGSR